MIPLSTTVFISWDGHSGTTVSIMKHMLVIYHHGIAHDASIPPSHAPTFAPSMNENNHDPVIDHLDTASNASVSPTFAPSSNGNNQDPVIDTLPTFAPSFAPSTNENNQDEEKAIKDLMHRSRNMFGQPTFSHTNFTWDNGTGTPLPLPFLFSIFYVIRISHIAMHHIISHSITYIVSITVDVSSVIYANAWIPFPIHVHVAALDVGLMDVLDDLPKHMGTKRPDSTLWTVRY